MIDIYAENRFYLSKIWEAVNCIGNDDTQGIGTSVFSFFSGSEYQNGQQAEVSAHHFKIIFIDKKMRAWCESNPVVLLRWIEAIFFYFRSMSAIPEIAQAIWHSARSIVERLRNYEMESLCASTQLASWDFFYGAENHPDYLNHIKSIPLKSKRAKVFRSIFLSTRINQEFDDYKDNIAYTYKNRDLLSHANLAISVINYYCNVRCQNEILQELIRILTGRQMRNRVALGD